MKRFEKLGMLMIGFVLLIPAGTAMAVGDLAGATIIVAAPDSKDTTRADIVVTGPSAHEEIQAALDSLPSYGGRVLLLEGNYPLTAPFNLNRARQEVEGQGLGTILKQSNGSNAAYLIGMSATFTKVSRLFLDGNKTANTGTVGIYIDGSLTPLWVHLSEMRIESTPSHGIQTVGQTSPQITRVDVYLTDGRGMAIMGGDTRITDCDVCVTGVTNRAIDFAGENSIISQCKLGGGQYSLALWDCRNIVISGNFLGGSDAYDMLIFGSTNTRSQHITITGNVFADASFNNPGTYSAILLDQYSHDNVITGNTFVSTTQKYAIEEITGADSNIISNNVTTGGTPGGFLILGPKSIKSNNIID